MASIDTIVDVQISKDTATVSRVGFGTPAMLTYHTAFPELARVFGSLDEVQAATGGPFAANSREVAIATAMFAQNPKPPQIVILRRATAPLREVTITPVTDATAGKPRATTAYSITLGDGLVVPETFTFTTDATPTVAEITAGLVALINAGTVNVLATDNTTDITIESAATPGGVATAGVPFTMDLDRALMTFAEVTADAGIAADLAAARLENDDWYALVSDATSDPEINALATAIEALLKIYIAESAEDDIPTTSTTDTGSDLLATANVRTGLFWHQSPHDSPGGAWLGKQLPTDPGSTTWKFKTLATIAATPNVLTSEQSELDNKNVNHYQNVSGINITAEGTMGGGEFIDITRGIDWLTARLKERVFRVLAVNPKIPFTDNGIQAIVNEVEGQLEEAVTNGLIASDPAFVVTAPRASEVATADKAARLLPDINFTATLAGAVHKVEIRGRVTV